MLASGRMSTGGASGCCASCAKFAASVDLVIALPFQYSSPVRLIERLIGVGGAGLRPAGADAGEGRA